MGYLWSVQAASGANVAAVYDRLHEISCSEDDLSVCTESASSGRIASDLLVPGFSYKFSVTVTNFWGASATDSVVVYKSESPIPRIMIEGESVRTVTRSDQVWLHSQVQLSDCLTADQQMDYEWSVVPGSPPITLDPAVVGFRDLVLQPGTLESGQTYQFNFRGTVRSNPELYSNAMVQLNVGYAPFTLAVVGGSRRVPADSHFGIRNAVTDPEDPDLTSYLSFTWACINTVTDGECSDELGFRNLMSTGGVELAVRAGMLAAG